MIKRTRLIYKLIERRRRHDRAFRVQTDGLGANSGENILWAFPTRPVFKKFTEPHCFKFSNLFSLLYVSGLYDLGS